jgi:chromosome segregation ATPase
MAGIKNLFGKDVNLEKLPAELKPLVEQMRQERAAYEALVKRAEQLGPAVAQMEQRLAGLDKLAPQFAELQKSAAALSDGQRAAEARLADTKGSVDKARADLDKIRDQVNEVLAVKAELPAVVEMVKPLGAIRSEVGTLAEQLKEVSGGFAQVREEHQKIARESAAALSRLAGVEKQIKDAGSQVEAFTARAQGLETAVGQLQQLIKDVPDVKRELSTLNVLAEFVTRKVSALESQKDMVERATQRAERLTELTGQVDRQLQEQHENAKFLGQIEKNVGEIKTLHEMVLQRGDELSKRFDAMEAETKNLDREFASARDALRQSAAQFTFEKEGLDALSQRVSQLREAVSAAEQRLPAIEQARGGLDGLASESRRLAGVVKELGGQVQGLEATASAAQAAQTEVQRLQEAVGGLTRRMDALAPARVSEELDQRAAEIEEVRSRVARLEIKLADWAALEERVDQSLQAAGERQAAVEALRTDLQRLFQVADSAVTQVRAAADLHEQIAQRRRSLDTVVAQLEAIDRQAASLEERKKQFTEAEARLARLDAALIDLQTTLQAVLDQKQFLEQVVETAGSLALQTMQAEAAIRTLREAAEDAKGRRA